MVGTLVGPSKLLTSLAMQEDQGTKPSIPLWLKIAWSGWIVVWAPVYWRQYGAQNFLFFCDLGNFLIAVGLWLESPLILSWQAVALLFFQTLYTLDLVGTVLFRHHFIGGTEYMFDSTIPLLVRLLGLYHVVVPPLLLWTVRWLGYDRRAWKLQTLFLWILLPINFFWRPEYNVNWARGLGHEQYFVPAWMYVIAYLIVVPAVIYWPTHLLLELWGRGQKPTLQEEKS